MAPNRLATPSDRHVVSTLGRLANTDARLILADQRRPEAGWRLMGRSAREDQLAEAVVGDLRRRGLLIAAADGSLHLSEAGARLARRASRKDEAYAQHRVLRRQHIGGASVELNVRESPLAWLRSRKGRDGQPLIGAEEFEAGERLRADYTLAQLEARTTAAWDAVVNSGSRGRSGQKPESLSVGERALAARQRVYSALDAVGPELSGILLEVCCLERGLEAAEKRLGWPQRAAKLILRMALAGLARHYGLTRPPSQASAGVHHWGSEGYRPAIGESAG